MAAFRYLTQGQSLTQNDWLQSPSGHFRASMIGTFSVYAWDGKDVLTPLRWEAKVASGHYHSPVATMQSDGNFVIYALTAGGVKTAVWATGTNRPGSGQFFASLEDDGLLHVYSGTPSAPGATVLWTSQQGRHR